jgi:signal transduction histidine kinase
MQQGSEGMIENTGKTILLVSDDAAFCAAARHALEAKEKFLRVAAVSTLDAARRIVADVAPAAILLEDSAASQNGDAQETANDRSTHDEHAAAGTAVSSWLQSSVSALAVYAPVVVIGDASHENDLTSLLSAGNVDFVARAPGHLITALELLQQRLLQAHRPEPAPGPAFPADGPDGEAFGEILRHELNNPLTGILGNAELLLAEVRRKNDGQLPNGGQQRLETIAALAVRLRETVRRLSQDWETRHLPIQQRAIQQRAVHYRPAH